MLSGLELCSGGGFYLREKCSIKWYPCLSSCSKQEVQYKSSKPSWIPSSVDSKIFLFECVSYWVNTRDYLWYIFLKSLWNISLYLHHGINLKKKWTLFPPTCPSSNPLPFPRHLNLTICFEAVLCIIECPSASLAFYLLECQIALPQTRNHKRFQILPHVLWNLKSLFENHCSRAKRHPEFCVFHLFMADRFYHLYLYKGLLRWLRW